MSEMHKEFYIDDDGIKLHAKLDMPEGFKKETSVRWRSLSTA